MLVVFQSKNILKYFKTTGFIILLSFIFFYSCSRQSAAVRATKKAEQIKINQQKEAEASEVKAKKRHFDLQTKKVQERMKENERNTEKYYNKKLKRSFFARLFGKKKKT